MAKLIIATLLSLLLALASVEGANIDESCTGADKGDCIDNALCTLDGSVTVCKCATGFTAIEDKTACKKNAGQTCATDVDCITNKCDTTCRYKEGDTGCLTDATCISGTACTDVSSVKKCTTLIDGACTGTDQSTCPAEATCTSLVCKCNTGYTANTAKSTCGNNGAAGVTASLVLMAAAIVASRFF